MSADERYAYSEEEGFFVDMANLDPEHPDLGTELTTDDVLSLLNKHENELILTNAEIDGTSSMMLELQQECIKLRKYAKHHLGCDFYIAHDIGPDSICECGLREVL